MGELRLDVFAEAVQDGGVDGALLRLGVAEEGEDFERLRPDVEGEASGAGFGDGRRRRPEVMTRRREEPGGKNVMGIYFFE